MTLLTVLFAAITRKVKAVVTEYRKLVAEAKVREAQILRYAQEATSNVLGAARAEEIRLLAEARAAIAKARDYEKETLDVAKVRTENLYEEVINKIANL